MLEVRRSYQTLWLQHNRTYVPPYFSQNAMVSATSDTTWVTLPPAAFVHVTLLSQALFVVVS